ncbi:MAG TPA: cytochrome C [Polyangia bacterium]|nr:cytochrome C [Polyangia bacterium]
MAEATEAAAPPTVTDEAGTKAAKKVKEIALPNRIHTWPYLVRLEFLTSLIVMTVMTAWSIAIDAPLEEPANPNKTPNPSKAPWYFLGLQEMLVYFDPWMAGVVLPSLIIVGLMVIPYIDFNPRGNGYYTFAERKFAIGTFLFGFLVLWVVLIFLGTFMRGPGWYFFWPGQYWDPHKTVALTNVDFPYLVGARTKAAQFIIGAIAFGAVFMWPVALFPLIRKKEWYKQMGFLRFNITAMLFATMMALPVKMVLRWTFNIKYLWVTPWFNI